jgi:hypothetical protein
LPQIEERFIEMLRERLLQLEQAGWRITRDGSTATARLDWDDPEDPDSSWQIMVLHTAGHGARFSLEASGWGLTERSAADARRFQEALAEALELMEGWGGELAEERET